MENLTTLNLAVLCFFLFMIKSRLVTHAGEGVVLLKSAG